MSTTNGSEALFSRLPANLFAPLAGPNRVFYAEVLTGIFPLFFEHEHHEVFPSRETVRAEIEEQLARIARLRWAAEEDEEQTADEVALATPSQLAQRVYRRFVQTGGLEEEHDGYRVQVVVPPEVGTLLGTLLEITREQRVFYGGMVLSIYNNLYNALEQPEAQGLAFREAARDAQRFSRHLNNMVYGLKGLLQQVANLADRRLVLGHFFDDFVERFLVADYKRLKTRNNPFRFRTRILSMLRDLQFTPKLKARLQSGYQDQMDITDSEVAWRELDRDLRVLSAIFEQVDGHLARIDRYRYRFERRVADAVRYLDRTLPGMAPRCARLVEGLGRDLAAGRIDEHAVRYALPLVKPLPLGIASLRPPTAARRPPEPATILTRVVDPAVLARERALRVYLSRRRVNVDRIVAYLERHLVAHDHIDAEALSLETVEDWIAFSHLRRLHHLGPAGRRAAQRYRVDVQDEPMENAFVRCSRFTVHRV